MKNTAIVLIGAGCLLLTACKTLSSSNNTTAAHDRYTESYGTYTGMLPGADCPGIDVTLTLHSDTTFLMTYDYRERNTRFESKGKFSIDGNLLTAVGPQNDSTFFRMEEGSLRMLDRQKEVITGKVEKMFILKKTTDNGTVEFPSEPSRPAYEGFHWERVEGAGLKFWAQSNGNLRVVTDQELPGAFTERDGGSRQLVIRVFPLKNRRIEDVLELLSATPGWNAGETGRFEEWTCNQRPSVKRYILVPTGEYGEKYREQSQSEPIPSTCNGWGVGNSGMRYFEIHAGHPDKAIFVEIGQDAPLFDEQSIVLTD